METSLRVILLFVAALITIGIVWDAFLSRRKPKVQKKIEKPNSYKKPISKGFLFENPFEGTSSQHEEFDDVILLNSQTTLHDAQDASENEAVSEEAYTEEEIASVKVQNFARDLVVLTIMARKPSVFKGKKLIEAFSEAHLHYGEMNVFHRYENVDGSGKIIFSVTQAVEPGIFDYPLIDSFVTPGITLFFNIVKPNQAIAAFELMLRTAKQLAMRLDGEIKDDNQRYLTLPTIEKYRTRMRFGT